MDKKEAFRTLDRLEKKRDNLHFRINRPPVLKMERPDIDFERLERDGAERFRE